MYCSTCTAPIILVGQEGDLPPSVQRHNALQYEYLLLYMQYTVGTAARTLFSRPSEKSFLTYQETNCCYVFMTITSHVQE
jgi:hypothetical protein